MTHATSTTIGLNINTLCYHLPLVGQMNIDWGDGRSSNVDSVFSTDGVIHFYENVGEYVVTVTGEFTALEHHGANEVTSVSTDTEEVINALLVEGV